MGAGVRYVVWDYLHVPSPCRMHDRRELSDQVTRVPVLLPPGGILGKLRLGGLILSGT